MYPSFHYATSLVRHTLGGRALNIGPGSVRGPLSLQGTILSWDPVVYDDCVDVRYFFATKTRRIFGYHARLGISAFWPSTTVQPAQYRSGGLAAAAALVKLEAIPAILLADKGQFRESREEPVLLRLDLDEATAQAARCQLSIGSFKPGLPNNRATTVKYELPVETLLWRGDSRSHHATCHDDAPIRIKYLGPLDGPVIFDDLETSDIDIDLGGYEPQPMEDV